MYQIFKKTYTTPLWFVFLFHAFKQLELNDANNLSAAWLEYYLIISLNWHTA